MGASAEGCQHSRAVKRASPLIRILRACRRRECGGTWRAGLEYLPRTLIPVAANQRNNMDKASFVFCTALREHCLEGTEDDE
jgi:hypothetical protein